MAASVAAAEKNPIVPGPTMPPPSEKKVFSSSNGNGSGSGDCGSVLFDILNLEEIDTHLFRGYSPRVPRWGRIYGGQTVGQALVAAGRTIDSHFTVHSMHAMFIRPGNDDLPILYQVDPTRDGTSFCTRRVRAIQSGKDIFICIASFKLMESGVQMTHSDAMPKVPDPSTLPSVWEPYRKRYEKAGVDQFPFPVDIKRISPLPDKNGWFPTNEGAQTKSWVRVAGRLPDNPVLHVCALAYLSDWGLLSTSMIPHRYNVRGNKHVQMASIDHSIWFHAPFRADEWLLHDTYSPRASNGTGLNFGKFYTLNGVHCVSTAQEGLIRLSQSQPPEMPLSADSNGTATAATATATANATAAAAGERKKSPKAKSKAGGALSASTAADASGTAGTGAAANNDRFGTPSQFFDKLRKSRDGTAPPGSAGATAGSGSVLSSSATAAGPAPPIRSRL